LQELLQRERELEIERKESATRADYLRFVVREIEEAKLRQGEEDSIDTDIRRLSHAEELQSNAGEAAASLAGGERSVLAQLRSIRRVLVAIERIDSEASRWLQSVDEVMVTLDELARDVESFAESVEADPARLRTLEQRRDQLLTLLRKYGPTVDDALSTVAESRAQLALVDDASTIVAELSAQRSQAEQELNELARSLTKQRRDAARRLSKEVTLLLPELGMVSGAFTVTLVSLDAISSHGSESVQFSAALNAGSESRPLDRIASGGELSRLMLALSTVLARLQHVPTLIFDEIDAGIGGAVAWQVGALMQRVAEHHQVLAISHLAQIAAHADHHVGVQKGAVGAVTTADTSVLTDDARMIEIARMLGGDADREVSRAHARELLERGALARTATLDTTPRTNGRSAAKASQRRGKPV
jgi:DNA repair protein RecN (Recombination protein N)